MGQQKNAWTELTTGYSKGKTTIFNGKEYTDSSSEYSDTKYRIIECPVCGKGMLESIDHDSTPGCKSTFRYIEDRNCDCDKK